MNSWIAKNLVYKLVQIIRSEKVEKSLSRIEAIPQLSPEEISRIQRGKLATTLQQAYENIPYYHRLFQEAGIKIEKLSLPEDMQSIPVLKKEILRAHPEAFISRNGSAGKRTSKESTSGTSGHPMTVIKDRNKSGYIRAVMYRCYRQYGIDIGDKQARFWAMPIDRIDCYKSRFVDLLSNRIRLSAFMLDDASLERFTKKLEQFRPRYFYGYASVIYKYSQWLQENRLSLRDLNLLAIITTGEVLHDFQRELIAQVFECRVVNEYGSTEAGVLAFECPEGKLHVNADHLYLETIPINGFSDIGLILVTELNNNYNPLIRYQIGDVGKILNGPCNCGSGFPVISNLIGREDSFIITPKNKYIYDGVISYVLSKGIKQFQGVQHSKEELIIKIVKNNELTENLLNTYRKQLTRIVGTDLRITFELVSKIESEKSGKIREFISNIGNSETSSVAGALILLLEHG